MGLFPGCARIARTAPPDPPSCCETSTFAQQRVALALDSDNSPPKSNVLTWESTGGMHVSSGGDLVYSGAAMSMTYSDPLDVLLGLQRALEARLESDWLRDATTSMGPFPPINIFQQGEN